MNQPLRTRDRRQVEDMLADPGSGEITGRVPMVGACRWRADGRLLALPGLTFTGEAAGPLDLVLAPAETGPGPRQASMADALADPDARQMCCD